MAASGKLKKSFVSLFLVLFLLACNFSGIGSDPPVAPPATPSPATADPEALEPPPEDIFNLLYERIEAGEEPGAVIVENLKVYAGELSLEQIYGTEELLLVGEWGLFTLAADYLENGSDEAARKEIRRLLHKIVPPEENLLAYAEPAPGGTSQAGLPARPVSPLLDAVCEDVWNEGFPQGGDPKPICLLYESGPTAEGHEYKIFFPKEWVADAAKMGLVKSASDAVKETVAAYSGIGLEMRSLNVLFTILQPVTLADALAAIPGLTTAQQSIPCPLLLFPLAHSLDYGDFKQTVAHELAHCAQHWRYGLTNYAVTKWWVEGTAEYFSNVAYPINNYEYDYNSAFDAASVSKPITDLSYHNAGFFQYLENISSAPGVVAFIDAMDKYGDAAQQMATLQSYPNFEEIFHGFAQAYLDGKIMDTGGGVVPYNPLPGQSRTAVHKLALETKPFVVTRYQLVFPAGNEYALGGGSSGSGRNSARPSASGPDWGSLPPTLSAVCEDVAIVLLMTSADAVGIYSVEIDPLPGQELGCDSCLFGQWRMAVNPQLMPYFESVYAGTDMSLEALTGEFHMFFQKDGGWQHIIQDFGTHTSIPSSNMDVLVAIYGGLQGTFNVDKDKTHLYLTGVTSDMGVSTVAYLNGQEISGIPADAGQEYFDSLLNVHNWEYSCSGATLRLFVPLGLPSVPIQEYVYTKQ